MKKILCLLLTALMVLPLSGCRLIENIGEVINGVIEHEAGATTAPTEGSSTIAERELTLNGLSSLPGRTSTGPGSKPGAFSSIS